MLFTVFALTDFEQQKFKCILITNMLFNLCVVLCLVEFVNNVVDFLKFSNVTWYMVVEIYSITSAHMPSHTRITYTLKTMIPM